MINFISLDGVIQAPLRPDEDADGGFVRGGWVQPYMDETVARFMSGATSKAAGMLLGRRVSQTLDDPAWHNTVRLGPDLPAEVQRIRAEGDGEILVFGSGRLLQALHQHDLVDEYPLLIFPILLGGGKRMVADTAALTRFRLADSQISDSGVTINSYRREA